MKTPLALLLARLALAQAPGDGRDDFEAFAHLGLAVDSFAAQAHRDALYANPQDNGEKRERLTGGFGFAYRLAGNFGRRPRVWVLGETLHGVRSSEVNCSDPGSAPPVCAAARNPLSTANAAPGKQLVYLLRNASSLEARAGLRLEFLALHPEGAHPARVYLKADAGFLSVARSGGDIFDVHRIALGALSTGGYFQGSYLEAGYGRNDVFRVHRYRRAVVDGYLTWGRDRWRQMGIAPFVRMVVDSDAGPGADSAQSFLGLNFDLGKLFRGSGGRP